MAIHCISKTKPSLSLPYSFITNTTALPCPKRYHWSFVTSSCFSWSFQPPSLCSSRVCILVLVRLKAQFPVAGSSPDTGLHSMETFNPFWCYFLNTGKASEGSPRHHFGTDGIHGCLLLWLFLLLLLCSTWLPLLCFWRQWWWWPSALLSHICSGKAAATQLRWQQSQQGNSSPRTAKHCSGYCACAQGRVCVEGGLWVGEWGHIASLCFWISLHSKFNLLIYGGGSSF